MLLFCFMALTQFSPEVLSAYLPVVVLALFLFETGLIFPMQRNREDLKTARGRVLKKTLGDPVFYLSILSLLYIIVQTLNGPRELLYNRALRVWDYTDAPIPFLPSSLNMGLSIQAGFWVLSACSLILIIRNSIVKKEKFIIAKFLLGVATLYAVISIYLYSTSAKKTAVSEFTNFAFPEEAGIFFCMGSIVSFGLLLTELKKDQKSKYKTTALFISFIAGFIAAVYSFSAIITVTLLISLLLIIIYAIADFVVVRIKPARSSVLVIFLLIFSVAFFFRVVGQESQFRQTYNQISSWNIFTEAETATRNMKKAIAVRAFKDNAAYGIGTWCFGDQNGMSHYIENDEWNMIPDSEGPVYYVSSDFFQFLAEWGLAGFLILTSPFIYMAVVFLIRVFMLLKNGTPQKFGVFGKKNSAADRINLFDIITLDIFSLLTALSAAFAVSFTVSIFRTPVNILFWSVLFSTATQLLLKPADSQKQ